MSPSFKTIPLCFSLSLVGSLFQTQDTLLALSVIASTIENPPPLMFVSLQSPPPSSCKRTPPFRKNPLTSKSPLFPVFLSKPLPAPMYTIRQCVILTHHHGRAMLLATYPCSFLMAEKGSPSFWKWMEKTSLSGPRQMKKTIRLLRGLHMGHSAILLAEYEFMTHGAQNFMEESENKKAVRRHWACYKLIWVHILFLLTIWFNFYWFL